MQAIIDVLQADGRATPERIAVMTGLEVEVVRQQVEAWEREGVIRRYKAVIDPVRLRAIAGTEMVTALIDVSVSPQRGVGFDAVAGRIARFSEVRSVCLVSGGQDLRCEVTGRTMADIADFVAEKLATIDQVRSTATHFVMKTYKSDGELFLPEPGDHRLSVAP